MKTILSDEELLIALKNGIWTKVKEIDDEYTHYNVIDFNSNALLICISGVNWQNGETNHYPHTVSQHDKNETWFFEKPILQESTQ